MLHPSYDSVESDPIFGPQDPIIIGGMGGIHWQPEVVMHFVPILVVGIEQLKFNSGKQFLWTGPPAHAVITIASHAA